MCWLHLLKGFLHGCPSLWLREPKRTQLVIRSSCTRLLSVPWLNVLALWRPRHVVLNNIQGSAEDGTVCPRISELTYLFFFWTLLWTDYYIFPATETSNRVYQIIAWCEYPIFLPASWLHDLFLYSQQNCKLQRLKNVDENNEWSREYKLSMTLTLLCLSGIYRRDTVWDNGT